MNYPDTLQWMYAQLPMYQRQGKQAFKKDLNNILLLDKHLGFPSQKIKTIHIAGTNGKGSVSHMLASVWQEAGYKTGLYTSPHLKDFRERIRINGQMIRKNCVINFIKRNQKFLQENHLSFFEMTVGMAFEYFAKKKVDIAVIETGLGGRLDSTNIITPELSVITNIGLDHTQMLGDTLEKIAFEKAGIIKENTPVVIGRNQPEIRPVFEKIAREKKSPLFYATAVNTEDYPSVLKGNYQKENIATVLKAIEILRTRGYRLTEENIRNGLLKVIENTGLRGRWDVLQTSPLVIADTAHNQDGLQFVVQQLQDLDYQQLHMILSVVNDKDLDKILPLFPKEAKYYFSKANIPRGLDAEVLRQKAKLYGLRGKTYTSVQKAYQSALQSAAADDVVFVGGSTFTVAEVL